MSKIDRVKQCLVRAGVTRLPPDAGESLTAYGLDSLVSVLIVIELQKEFGIAIPSRLIGPETFGSVKTLAGLVPD
jgi:acyl carrier protein